MRKRTIGGILAITIATSICLAGAVPAFAETSDAPKTLAAIQAAGAAATNQRIVALQRTIPTIQGNTCIVDGDRDVILGTLNTDLAGMQSLAATIAADTDAATAASDYQSIFTGYRVYGVGLAQAHYAAAADCITSTGLPALVAAQAKLTTALAGPLAGKSTPAIEASMADLATQIATAQSATDGLAASALAVTPDDFNADPTVLSSTKLAVSSAVEAVRLGKQDAQSVLEALK